MNKNQSSCTSLSIPGETRIALGVSEANRLHRYATSQAEMAALAGKNAVMAVLRLGKILQDLKCATVHGEWGKLFSGKQNSNSTHGSNFDFDQRTANRYMRCYQEAAAKLSASEAAQLSATLENGTMPSGVPMELIFKATGGAETPRQMMLNLNVRKDGSKSAAHAARLTQHETILKNRGKGRAADPVNPEQAMMEAVTAVLPEEELREQKVRLAVKDAYHLVEMMEAYLDDELYTFLPGPDRNAFLMSLKGFERIIKNGL